MQSSDIKVSVLVPVYNVEDLLPRCLDSIVNQTLKEIEIVCVNDASPDSSLKVLEEYAKRDTRIKVISHTINMGLLMARRTGYQNANGRYIFFCDSDDFLPADALENLYRASKTSNADIIVGNMELIYPSGRRILRDRANKISDTAKSYLKAILNWTTPSLAGSLFRRELFFNENLPKHKGVSQSEDRILLTTLLLEKPTIETVGKTTYYYRQNNASISHAKITPEAAIDQFKNLYICYTLVENSDFNLKHDNDNFLTRFLSLYIEKGVSPSILINFNKKTRELIKFNTMAHNVGVRLAIHTHACMNIPGYRFTMHGIRKVIRKLQGKD